MPPLSVTSTISTLSRSLYSTHLSSHPRIFFTGIQPTGVPHLGNYFGMIEPWLQLQKSESADTNLLLSVVDQHAISVGPQIPNELRSNTHRMSACLLSCGVCPSRTLLFRQSDVSEIAQLNWILGSLQTITKLQRLPQYKDKAAKFSRGEVPVGLLTYPLLQAADVLLFKGTHVPVGEDQSQHMNLLADLAYAFNKTFNTEYFPIPQQVTRASNARIRSLRDPSKKMSKSEKSERSRIELSDSCSLIEEKCKKAVSDSIREVTYNTEERLAVANMIDLLSAVSGVSVEEIVEKARDWDVGRLKAELASKINERIGPIREKYEYYENHPNEIVEILTENGKKARVIAEKNIGEIKEIVGFL